MVFEYLSVGVLLPGGGGIADPSVDIIEPMLLNDEQKELQRKRLDLGLGLTDDEVQLY